MLPYLVFHHCQLPPSLPFSQFSILCHLKCCISSFQSGTEVQMKTRGDKAFVVRSLKLWRVLLEQIRSTESVTSLKSPLRIKFNLRAFFSLHCQLIPSFSCSNAGPMCYVCYVIICTVCLISFLFCLCRDMVHHRKSLSSPIQHTQLLAPLLPRLMLLLYKKCHITHTL